MRRLFNLDNPVMRFLSLLCDTLFLNILFLISCIPIVTIGAALTAMEHVTIMLVRKEMPTIGKEYFKAFKKHFKQATLLWIPLFLLISFFISDLYVIFNVIGPQFKLLQVPVWIFLFLIFSVIFYAFPMMSAYPNNTKVLVKNSLLISLSNLPVTIFIFGFTYFIARASVSDAYAFILIISIFIFWGFALTCYIFMIFINRLFEKIEKMEAERAGVATDGPITTTINSLDFGDSDDEDEDSEDSENSEEESE